MQYEVDRTQREQKAGPELSELEKYHTCESRGSRKGQESSQAASVLPVQDKLECGQSEDVATPKHGMQS